MTTIELPPMPSLTPAIAYEPWELYLLVENYGRSCAEAGAALERERAELDAKRYRWLRDASIGQFEHPIAVSQERGEFGMRYIGPLIGKSLDAAIDDAISAQPKSQEETP